MLVDWGNEAATNLIQHNIPLNDTITKIASDYSLNSDQLSRLVESANISMHTSVYTNNKYPEFEVADIKKVAGKMQKTAAYMYEASDYDVSPNDHNATYITKTAMYAETDEIEVVPEAVYNKVKYAVEDAKKHYEEKLAEVAYDIYATVEDIKHDVRQAVLDIDQRESAIPLFKLAATTTCKDSLKPALNLLFEDINETLQHKCPESAFKVASLEPDMHNYGVLNINHPVLKKVANYLNLVEKYKNAVDNEPKILSKIAEDTMSACSLNEKQASFLSKSLLYGLPAAAILGTTAVTAHKIGEEGALAKMAPMMKDKLPPRYRKY